MKKLSEKQKKVLEFLTNYTDARGYPPSIRDIAAACKISSTSVVDYNLKVLENGGYIRRDPEVSRGIEIIESSRRREKVAEIPLLGYVAAGEPIPVPQADTWTSTPLEMIVLPDNMVTDKKAVYALKVKGTSMIDALIDDGDTILVRQTQEVRNGDMAVVWLKKEMESTLKRIYFSKARKKVRLQPANRYMEPIYTELNNIDVQGKVVAVIRLLG
ncbi:MAG: transcriptional repressor LexA [Dehalococcoidia bacterium]|nr:transcriptional repressor LexA [Dehalococcoidia bacterium]